ncbi:Cho2 [Kluyveromyces lactis]|nr:Cho2 [Kluyveromyces lactis]
MATSCESTVLKSDGKLNSHVKIPIAHPRSSSTIRFDPPKTHDMVRSLFDPTLKKSFLECCITATIIGNVILCYYAYQHLGANTTKIIFLSQYIFWRLSYNLGIGIVLHYQSHYESLTNFTKKHALFDKKTDSLLSRFVKFEISAKYQKGDSLYRYPEEWNTWLLFRQFVDLILMQDFTTYMLYVVISLPHNDILNNITSFNSIGIRVWLGVLMVLFNIWVKIDAHSVVKDYAWYWGDFFFLQDANLVFDGVFNVFPHPMYSIGYIGYYGLSLISGDHHVLFVSILGHCLQFLFLKYVETPHIERIYGSDSSDEEESIDDKMVKQLDNYSKPLVTTFLGFKNFDKFKPTDYITLITVASIVVGCTISNPSFVTLSKIALTTKIVSSVINMTILYKQSNSKWFTSLYLKNGYNEIYAYQMWQFIYNLHSTINYILLVLQCYYHFVKCDSGSYNTITFGLLLLAIQIWCNTEIFHSIKEFGWFYGDFFLPNLIDKRKLKNDGIYRYLNNPERVFGVAGIWGTVLINNFSNWNLWLATTWTMFNWFTVKFIETPHLLKVYGTKPTSSGFEKTLTKYKFGKDFKSLIDKVDQLLDDYLFPSLVPKQNVAEADREGDWESIINMLLIREQTVKNLHGTGHFNLDIVNINDENTIRIPEEIEIKWTVTNEAFHKDDWIGLYKVVETGEDRLTTKIPSQGHWSAVSSSSSYSEDHKKILHFDSNDHFTYGSIKFDKSILCFEEGIYEFRYHSANTHDVVMISKPFKLLFPQFKETVEDVDHLIATTKQFLKQCGVLINDNKFDLNRNKYFTGKTLQNWYKSTMDTDVSVVYMKRTNFDIDIITKKVWQIKQVLDNLE